MKNNQKKKKQDNQNIQRTIYRERTGINHKITENSTKRRHHTSLDDTRATTRNIEISTRPV